MPGRVLIVDDHASFRAVARAMLEAHGFEVVGEAADGAGAIVACARLEPAVVLLASSCPTTTASRSPSAWRSSGGRRGSCWSRAGPRPGIAAGSPERRWAGS
jgi:DNA-binding NarL/FixJ family response regulator